MSRARQSSFQKIRDDILVKIRARHWLPGETIPGEEALAEEYGCSRMTVNRAIRELADRGIVERRRKAGTRVALQPDRQARVEISSIRKEIEERGSIYRYALLERSEATASEGVQAKLSLSSGDRVLHLRCLHFADEVPYQYEDRWINLRRVPSANDEPFDKTNPNEWLIEKEPFSEAEHVFSAQIADGFLADILGIDDGAALFVVDRRTWQDGDTITAVKLYHPGTMYRLVSRG